MNDESRNPELKADPVELAGRIQDWQHEPHMAHVPTWHRAMYLKNHEWDAIQAALRATPSETGRKEITAQQIHQVYQEEFYRKVKPGGALAHSTHADLIKAVIHRLLGVEITEPWGGDPSHSERPQIK